jgi:hypothetical protein
VSSNKLSDCNLGLPAEYPPAPAVGAAPNNPVPAGLAPNIPPVVAAGAAPNPVVAGLAPKAVEVFPNNPPVLVPALAVLVAPNAGVEPKVEPGHEIDHLTLADEGVLKRTR